MLEFIAAALVQLPAANRDTVNAVARSAEPLMREPVAGARVRAFADEKGTVQSCEVVSFVGSQRSADVICTALRGKKVKPARDTDGSRIGGFIETIIAITSNMSTPMPVVSEPPADVRLNVEQLPDGMASPFRFNIGLIVDERGEIAACGPLRTEHESMAAQACQSVEGKIFVVIHDQDGVAVRYARSLHVEVTVGTETAPGA